MQIGRLNLNREGAKDAKKFLDREGVKNVKKSKDVHGEKHAAASRSSAGLRGRRPEGLAGFTVKETSEIWQILEVWLKTGEKE